MATKQKTDEQMVVILTEFREIFCGWTSDASGDRISLRAARQVCYYSAETHGLLGLAVTGPAKGSKVGPAADMEIRRPVNVIKCTLAAVAAWEGAQWAN